MATTLGPTSDLMPELCQVLACAVYMSIAVATTVVGLDSL